MIQFSSVSSCVDCSVVLASIEIKLKAVSINFKIEIKIKRNRSQWIPREWLCISNAPSHLVLEEQLQHLHVLVVDGHEQRGPAQPIRDQYHDILTNHSSPAQRVHAVHVDHGGRVLQHPDRRESVIIIVKLFMISGFVSCNDKTREEVASTKS